MLISDRHDRARQKKRFIYGVTAFVIFVILFFSRGFFGGPVGGALSVVFRPVWILRAAVSETVSGWLSIITAKERLQEENRSLREELDMIALEAYERDLLVEENSSLKEMLGRTDERDLILATVLVRPADSAYDTIVLDVGSLNGVFPGARVYTDGNFLLGEAAVVHGHTTIVKLYSSPGTELAVLVGSSTPVAATAYGQGGGNFRIALPRGTDIVPGDAVLVPSIGPTFSGIVDHVETTESSSFASIFFKLPINWSTLRYVYVDLAHTGALKEATSTDPIP